MAPRRSTDWDLELRAAVARSRKRRGKRRSRLILRAAVALVVVGVASVVLLAATLTSEVIAGQCSLRVPSPLSLGANSFVTASDGSLLGAIPSTRNRQQLSLAQIS